MSGLVIRLLDVFNPPVVCIRGISSYANIMILYPDSVHWFYIRPSTQEVGGGEQVALLLGCYF